MQGCPPFEAVLKSALKHENCNEGKIRNSIKNVKDKTFRVNRCVLLQCNGAPSCVLKENVRGHSLYPDVWSSGGRQQHHHLALLKTHLLAQHCLSAVIHHKGFELLMEAASASRPLSMIHSLSPSVRRPLLLPSSSSPPLFSGLSLNDGCVKSLTASDGHIQHSRTSQVRSLWCNPPQIFNQLLPQSRLWCRTKPICNFGEEILCEKVISERKWQLFEHSQLSWGQRSINQLLAESITIVPLDAPSIVNDKLHPARFLEVVRCILAECTETHWEGIK